MRALLRAGVFGNRPLRSGARLLWLLARHGPTLPAVVAWHARRTPERLAVADAHTRLSCRELWQQTQSVAGALAREMRPGNTVGLLADGVPFVVGLLGGLRAGARVVLLPDGLRADALAQVTSTLGVRIVMVDDQSRDLPAGVPARPLSTLGSAGHRALSPRVGRPVVLTSGTTGAPRPVTRRLRPLAALKLTGALVDALGVRAGSPTLLPLPLHHGHGLATVAAGLALGAPLHLRRGGHAAELWTVMERENVEVLSTVPTLLYRLLAVPGRAPTLRTVVSGSAPLEPSLARRARDALGPVLYDLYGTSETGVLTLATPHDLHAEPGSVGRPLPGVRLRVSEDGSVHARTPLSGGEVTTGDLGEIGPHGHLRLRGRADDVMVIGGENVWPAPIEAVIAALPGVRECAVVPVPHAEYGQAVRAFVVAEPGADPAGWTDALRAHLPRRLRPVDITVWPALPRTPTGKLRRAELRGHRD